MNDETDFNRILQKRSIPKPGNNLASRITAAATMQKHVPFHLIVMQEVMDMIVLPKPAYALAASLVLGLVVGFQIEMANDVAIQDWFSFAQIEEEGWL